MLADKTLLSATLLVTFASGTFVGFAAGRPDAGAAAPRGSDAIYARQLSELRERGYDEAEMARARDAYAEYLRGMGAFWNEFLETYQANVRVVDEKLERRLDEVDAGFRTRTAAK